MDKKDDGKVPIKTILKGTAAQAIKPAVMSGFKVADFQLNPAAKESTEERLKVEILSLQSKIATLNGEISNAAKKAEQDIKAAQEKGIQEGKISGYADGEKKAAEKMRASLKELQEESVKSLEAIGEAQKEYFAKIEHASSEIAIAIAKRVFCEEAAQNPNIITRIMQEAFTFLGQEEKIKVRLNPMDVTFAEQSESIWKPPSTQLKEIEIVFDNSVTKGGCMLEAQNGSSIDMRIETVFGHIEEVVKRLYNA